MADTEDSVLTLDEIKKEPSEDGSDMENHAFGEIDEGASIKEETLEKEGTEGTKSDDDMQG